jgi:hypothetical protein
MFRAGSFFVRLLVVLLLIGGLAAGGAALYQAGQAQGYALGIAAADGDQLAQPPAAPFYPGYYMPRPFFFPLWAPFGIFFSIGMFFLFFFMVGGLFRFLFWGRFRGRGPWRHHPYGSGWAPERGGERGEDRGDERRQGAPEPPNA